LTLRLMQRQRRASGQWGKFKPLKVSPREPVEIDEELDRSILAQLLGVSAERAGWAAQPFEAQSAPQRFSLSADLAGTLLARMCQTGRAIVADLPLEKARPLEWQSEPPWELSLDVALDATGEHWQLHGCLRRGEERMPVSEAMLVLPGGLVIWQHWAAPLRDGGTVDWLRHLGGSESIVVPRDDGAELVDRLLDLPLLPRLELPQELKLEECAAAPTPQLTLLAPRGTRWQHERLTAEVSFEYLGSSIRAASPQGAIVQREHGRCIPRDRPREEACFTQLEQLGVKRLATSHLGRADVEIPAKTLAAVVRGLALAGWNIRVDGRQVHQAGPLHCEIRSGIDWFELSANVDFAGRGVAFPELLAALARGDCTVRLPDGSYGLIPEQWHNQFGLLAGLGVADGDHVRFSRAQVGLLDALLAAQSNVQCDAAFAQMRQRVRQFMGIEPAAEPQGFSGTLRPYQRTGLGWLKFLEEFQFGGCLADDMGLGKTIQFLALLQDRLTRGTRSGPVLVVVPRSLIFNWHQECVKFTPQLKLFDYTGLERARLRKKIPKADVILTTYGTVRRDVLALKEIEFDYVVLDEAQAIKNPASQVAKSVRLLNARHRLALSGTPIENRLRDLWSIFEFLNPGMLGRASLFKLHADDASDSESRRLIAQALRPFILRRTKREVARELPEKLEQTILCHMGPHQEQLYNELRDHYRASLLGLVRFHGLERTRMHVLEALLRLRQAACHPGLLDEARLDEPSAKLEALGLHLADLLEEGHKALVFSQFTSYLAIVRRYLEQRNIAYEYLDGQTRDRKRHIEHFQTDPACGVFLISLKAGGLGLNLTAADYVFLLDPWWNPAVEAQAIDRAHRIGQTRNVFAYRLICHNTVEQKIAELQTQKKELAEAILQADGNLLADLSADDLEMLLS
jgi:superfamily II DNA or RNA helicase